LRSRSDAVFFVISTIHLPLRSIKAIEPARKEKKRKPGTKDLSPFVFFCASPFVSFFSRFAETHRPM